MFPIDLTRLILGWVRIGLGWIPNEHDDRDWDIDKMGLPRETMWSESLESSIPKVLNQQSVSSCVAHAIAGAIHIRETIADLAFDPVSPLYLYYFSRLQHSYPVRDAGTSIRTAVKVLTKLGVPPEHAWTFSTSRRRVNKQPTGSLPYVLAHPRRGGEYFAIKDSGTKRIEAIKACIAAGYPVVFGTPIPKIMQGREGVTVFDRPGVSDPIAGNHAMLIVGYRGDLFRVLNSWGPQWRDEGLCWFTQDYLTWPKLRDLTAFRGWKLLTQARKS